MLDTSIHADLHQRLEDQGFTDADARAVMVALLTTHRPGSDAGLEIKQIQDASGLEADAIDAHLQRLFEQGWVTHGLDVGTWRLNHNAYYRLTGQTALDAYGAATTRSGYAMHDLGRLSPRQELYEQARQTDAYKALRGLFGGWTKFLEGLTATALRRVVDNKLIDPSDQLNWDSGDRAGEAVLRRHGFTRVRATKLKRQALRDAVQQQAEQDKAAGLTWDDPASLVAAQAQLAAAHATCPLNLDDPSIWEDANDQRAALGRALKLDEARWDDLSRWALANPDAFDAGEARCWRIGSKSWMDLLDDQLGAFDGHVARPVGVFVTPQGSGWALSPTLSLDMIRLVNELGGRIGRDLTQALVPDREVGELLQRMNTNVLHNGDGEMLKSKTQLLESVNKVLGRYRATVSDIHLEDPRDAWGRLDLSVGDGGLVVTVRTFNKRDMKKSRLGSVGHTSQFRRDAVSTSATMDLGECVEVAAERSLPLLLSTEAAGLLAGQVRIGRMKGRPGQLTITSSDGISATTRRLVAAQAIPELRRLKQEGAQVTLDAGARQIVRMTLAKPLGDDPILLGRQTEVAALKVVGSGLDASDTGTGKSVTTGRALFHRAATTSRFRGLMTADGRLMEQWRGELLDGNKLSGMPPLAPNVDVLIVDDKTSPASQIRQWDRQLEERAGVALVPDGILDRYPSDLAAISWHVWIADEAVRYVNPATMPHRSALQLRTSAVADAWMLTATPKGKHAGHLDVLVGLAVGDVAMISERLNTRESGDLTTEEGAHRVRVNFGPTMVRITKKDMADWMPKVRPAEPLIVEADPALAELLQAIRDGGREAYRQLLAALKQLKAIEEREGKGSELYKEAMAAVSRWQAFVLANVNVFVDASVDPETLMYSEAVLAQALVEQGLVQNAMRGGGDGMPTLRGIVAQTLARTAQVGEQILVFAERTRCLHQLSRALHDRWGVEAPVGDGKVSHDDFEVLKHRFVAGDIPILMLSPVGNSGHNLQTASQIVHYDLPWVQIGLEQRVGRAGRMGSLHSEVQTAIPYIKSGGIEHIVSVLADRSVEHYQLLDSYEGVTATESTVAGQLGAITGQVAASKDDEGFGRTAARMRVAAAIFGANDA